VIKTRRVKWGGHVACMGYIRNSYKIIVGKLKRINHLETEV